MNVAVTVDRIFEGLRALGRTAADRRRVGLSSDDIVQRFKTAGLYCHPDVLAAYEAADGTDSRSGDTIGDLLFFPGYYWLPLDQAFETYGAISSDDQWRDDWFPIFASGGGDFYAVVCSDREAAFGSVVGFILGEPEQIIECPTLGALLEIVARSYEQGAFRVQEGHLKADYATFRAIAEQVSPGFQPVTVRAVA
jgi:hypothetical protein